MEDMIETGRLLAVDYGLNIVLAILTYVIGKWVARQIRKVVIKAMSRAKTD